MDETIRLMLVSDGLLSSLKAALAGYGEGKLDATAVYITASILVLDMEKRTTVDNLKEFLARPS